MLERCLLSAALALGAALNTTALAADGRELREELATTVPEVIRLLKEKKYEDWVASFVAPEELEQATTRCKMTIKEFSRRTEKDATVLLDILQGIDGKQPESIADGRSATFLYEGSEGSDVSAAAVTFVKVDQCWYLKNIVRIPAKADLEKARSRGCWSYPLFEKPHGKSQAEESDAADSR